MEFVIATIIISIMFFAVGIVVGVAITCQRPAGDLRVDHSDPSDGPYLFLELDTDVRNVMKKKYVIFRVKIKDFLPQK